MEAKRTGLAETGTLEAVPSVDLDAPARVGPPAPPPSKGAYTSRRNPQADRPANMAPAEDPDRDTVPGLQSGLINLALVAGVLWFIVWR